MNPYKLLQLLPRICAGPTTKQDLAFQDAYPNFNNTSAFLASAFRCSHCQLVSSSPFWSWQEMLGKDPQSRQNLSLPLSCDRETPSGGLSVSPKLVVRFSKPGPEAGLQISFQPVWSHKWQALLSHSSMCSPIHFQVKLLLFFCS